MKKIILFGLMFILLSSVALAAIPQLVSIQGRLTDTNGEPKVGAYDFTFKLTGSSTCLAADAIAGQTKEKEINLDSNGVFNAELDFTDAFSGDRWVEICVKAKTDATYGQCLCPRVQITSSGYAYTALGADDFAVRGDLTVAGGDLSVGKIGFQDQGGTALSIYSAPITGTYELDFFGNNDGILNLHINDGSLKIETLKNCDTIDTNSDGKLICGHDDIGGSAGTGTVTSVATGAGLTGGPITTTGTISIATGGVTGSMIADGTITSGDVAPSTFADYLHSHLYAGSATAGGMATNSDKLDGWESSTFSLINHLHPTLLPITGGGTITGDLTVQYPFRIHGQLETCTFSLETFGSNIISPDNACSSICGTGYKTLNIDCGSIHDCHTHTNLDAPYADYEYCIVPQYESGYILSYCDDGGGYDATVTCLKETA